MISLDRISDDIAYLRANKSTNYRDVSIAECSELIQRKEIYKKDQSLSTVYSVFKQQLKELRRYKLPFRVVEVVNHCLKNSLPIPSALTKIPPSNAENDRKSAKRVMEKKLLEKYATADKELVSFAEKITWVHGTNSSLLPFLPHTGYTLLCTGALLDQGLAPMSGEIHLGGMVTTGVNQTQLSAETVRDVGRSWRYATTISHTFDPHEYDDLEKVFLTTIEKLERVTPQQDGWDPLLIQLYRLKQWDPKAFTDLRTKYAERIGALKLHAKNSCSREELILLKALDYDEEKLRTARHDEKVRAEVEKDFSPYLEGSIFGESWYEDPNCTSWLGNSIYFFAMSKSLFGASFNLEVSSIINHTLRLKNLGKEDLECVFQDVTGEKNWIFPHLAKAVKAVLGDCVDITSFKDVYIRQKLEKKIIGNLRPFKRRYERLEKLFDEPPKLHLSDEEKKLIAAPFPLLIASTHSKAVDSRDVNEVGVKKATFGEEVDLLFVEEKDSALIEKWLSTHGLSKKIDVVTSQKISELSALTLYHAPSQVSTQLSCIDSSIHTKASQAVKEHVIPRYKEPYPDSSPRVHHGIVHAIGTGFFGGIILEMLFEKGVVAESKKEDLLLALFLHDVARENDGEDLWDKESGEKCTEIVSSLPNRTPEEGKKLGFSIANKDADLPTYIEQEIIHDGDCLEINRVLRNPQDFITDKLWIMKRLDEELVYRFVDEARAFISLRESPKIKAFIEASVDPYSLYFQILYFANNECHKFDLLSFYASEGIKTFRITGNYLLTPAIEIEIERHLNQK